MKEQQSNQSIIQSSSQQNSSQTSSDLSQATSQVDNVAQTPQNQFLINQDAANQIMTFYLQPTKSIWFKGEIIASNQPFYKENQSPIKNMDKIFLNYVKLNRIPARKLANTSSDLAYYCIRCKGGGGKILFLEESVYGEKFLFDYDKLLTINIDTDEYSLSNERTLTYLSKIIFKDKQKEREPLKITLQSNHGGIILQKSLGLKEKIFIGESSVIAVSQSVKIKRQNREVFIEGPGYVFIEGKSQPKKINNNIKNMIFIQMLVTVLLPLFTLVFVFDQI